MAAPAAAEPATAEREEPADRPPVGTPRDAADPAGDDLFREPARRPANDGGPAAAEESELDVLKQIRDQLSSGQNS